SESADGTNYNTAPLTLKEGGIGVHADLVINLSKDLVGKPIEISPNLYYGVTPELTLGVATNPFANTLPLGGGLCLSGTSNGCYKAFNNLSLDALYEVAPMMAVHGGLDILAFSPDMLLSLRGGVKMKFGSGPIGVLLDPALNIGLTKRDFGNKEFL